MVYVDSSGQESPASSTISVTVPPGNGLPDNIITLNNLPSVPEYSQIRIYRTAANGSQFFQLDTVASGGSFVDNGSAPLGPELNSVDLNGNYSYMITYYRAGDPESRPSILMGPQNVVNGRVHLTNLPTPPVPPPGGGFPPYDSIRIYRNTASDQNSFFLVDTIAPGQDYTDGKTDSLISDLSLPGNQRVNLNGPPIDSNTLLTNVTRLNGFDYDQPFQLGSLTFEGRKGGRALEAKPFEVTATKYRADLVTFMEQSMGIQALTSDSTNPIPPLAEYDTR